jgi:MFS family permease
MKVFYGWVVLFCVFLLYMGTNGIGLNTTPLFMRELSQQFGWDIALMTKAPALLYLVIGLTMPLAGWLLDRYGARKMLIVGNLGAIALLFGYSQISSLTHYFAFYILYGVCITLGGMVSCIYVLTRWFRKKLGLAIGLFLIASSLGGALFPPLAGNFIKTMGWQTAMQYMAAISVLFLALPLVFIRNQPSDMSLFPDGDTGDTATTAATISAATGVTLSETLRSPNFYLLLVLTGSMWFSITGFTQNQGFFLKDLQLDVEQSGLVIGLFFTCSILGKVLFGWLGDRYDKKNIMLLSIINLTIGTILLRLSVNNQAFLLPFAIGFGLGFSGVFTMMQVLVADVFRGKDYGKILGIVTMIDTVAGSAGVAVLGAMRKASGSYASAFEWMIGLAVAAMIATFFIKRPKRQVQVR